jgi:lysophospholipase L1-like esterase
MSSRRLAVLIVLLALATAAVASAAPGGTRVPKRVHVDGDSIAFGTDLFLARYLRGWEISSSVGVSRHAYQGAASIEALGAALPPVVLVNLGTNDDPRAISTFASYVRRVVRAAGPERCVIWATIVRPPYAGVSYDGLNGALLSAASRWKTFHVFDWRGLAHAHPAWFDSDGVHPSIPGYRVRAKLLARFIRSACA